MVNRTQSASRRTALAEAIEHPRTLVPLTIAGLAIIVELVLGPVVGAAHFAGAIVVVSVAVAGWTFVRRYSEALLEGQARIDAAAHASELEARTQVVAAERAALHERLELGFERLASDDGASARVVLEQLTSEFEGISNLQDRKGKRPDATASVLVPGLCEEAYRHGLSALSDALELLESTEATSCRRLQDALQETEGRLGRDDYVDEQDRERDEQRRASHRELLDRHRRSRRRAHDLIFEAERCTAALAEARIEMASARAGDTQIGIDAVIETLQHTIRRVRDVQDEFRRLTQPSPPAPDNTEPEKGSTE